MDQLMGRHAHNFLKFLRVQLDVEVELLTWLTREKSIVKQWSQIVENWFTSRHHNQDTLKAVMHTNSNHTSGSTSRLMQSTLIMKLPFIIVQLNLTIKYPSSLTIKSNHDLPSTQSNPTIKHSYSYTDVKLPFILMQLNFTMKYILHPWRWNLTMICFLYNRIQP